MAGILANSAAFSQEDTQSNVILGEQPVAVAEADLAVPESPAFYVLGLSPETVLRPATGREFAAGLLTGVDKNGHLQTGLAIDTSPYLLWKGNDLTIKQYRDHSFTRFLARTQLSIATSKGTDADDDSVRAAVGIRFVPYDNGDPRLSLALDQCFTGVAEFLEPIEGETLFDRQKRLTEAAKPDSDFMQNLIAGFEGCREKEQTRFIREKWTASSLAFGISPTVVQPDGSEDLRFAGTTFWGSSALAWGKNGQAVFGVRFNLDEEVVDPNDDDTTFEQDVLQVGARIRLGKTGRAFSLEGAYVYEKPDGASADSSYRIAVGGEFPTPFLDNAWLQVSVGATGARRGVDKVFILGTVKFGDGAEDLDLTRLAEAVKKVLPAH